MGRHRVLKRLVCLGRSCNKRKLLFLTGQWMGVLIKRDCRRRSIGCLKGSIGYQRRIIGCQTWIIGCQTWIIGYQWTIIGCQTGIIDYQSRIIGYRTPIIGYQTPIIGCFIAHILSVTLKWTTIYGRYSPTLLIF
jgi:hypothetical protein